MCVCVCRLRRLTWWKQSNQQEILPRRRSFIKPTLVSPEAKRFKITYKLFVASKGIPTQFLDAAAKPFDAVFQPLSIDIETFLQSDSTGEEMEFCCAVFSIAQSACRDLGDQEKCDALFAKLQGTRFCQALHCPRYFKESCIGPP